MNLARYCFHFTLLIIGLGASFAFGQTTPEDRMAPEPRIGFGVPRESPWFSHPGVQRQLGWDDKTRHHMTNHYGNYFAQYSDALNDLKDLSPAERRQRERDITAQFHNRMDTALEETLADEAARARYQQLHLQYHGVGAMSEPSVQKRLKLTVAQKEKFHAAHRQWEDALAKFFQDYPDNAKAATQKFEKARLEASKNFRETLTDAQKKTWQQYTGRPFEFPSDAYLPAAFHQITSPEK